MNYFNLRNILLILPTAFVSACSSYNVTGIRYPAGNGVTTFAISISADSIEIGATGLAGVVSIDGRGYEVSLHPIFRSTNPGVATVDAATGVIEAIAEGNTVISASVGSVTRQVTLTVLRPAVRINEVNSNGDTPGGFVELINPSDADVDISGWHVASSNISVTFIIPKGVVIPAHGFRALNEALFPFGLGSRDAVHLVNSFGAEVDFFTWTASPATSLGRCPDATGAFVATLALTRAASNACS